MPAIEIKKIKMKMGIDGNFVDDAGDLKIRYSSSAKRKTLPMGSSPPKYFWAMARVMTRVLGWSRAVAASPRIRGRVNTWKKLKSCAKSDLTLL